MVGGVSEGWGQAVNDYRSAATGNWNTLATWERWDGAAWVTPTAGEGTPNNTDGAITIRSPHNVTFNANATVDQVVIESGGTVTQTANMTIANGSGTDFEVNGTPNRTGGNLTIQASAAMDVNGTYTRNGGTLTTTGTLTFNNNSAYNHTQNGGTIPTATWSTNSNCNITAAFSGGGGTTISGMDGQTFGNVTYNPTSQNNNVWLFGPAATSFSTTIAGNFTIVGTGTGTLHFRISGGSNPTTVTANIGGNFSIQGGTIDANNSGGGGATVTLNLAGNYNQTGGTLTATGSGTVPIN